MSTTTSSTLIERSGLPPVRLHDLRHGVTTYARAAHVDPKTLPEMLGHAGVAFTLQTYGTVVDELRQPPPTRSPKVIDNAGEHGHTRRLIPSLRSRLSRRAPGAFTARRRRSRSLME